MKIAILTQPCTFNYGGILQAWALQQALKQLGHEGVDIRPIKWRPPQLNWRYWRTYPAIVKRALKILTGRAERGTEVFRLPKAIPSKKTMKFVNRQINLKYFNDWDEAATGMDALIIGSDQVWRREYNFRPNEVNFGSFAPDIPRIAYAASWGVDRSEYTAEENKTIIPWIKQLDAISVREESGVKICKDVYGVDAEVMPDPTLLLSADKYRGLFKPSDAPKSGKYLMTYFLDRDSRLTELANNTAKMNNWELYNSGSLVQELYAPLIERIHPSVEEWLAGIANCELLLTDSFHGTVFAILFNRPFCVVGNRERGISRLESLLKTFGLTDRLLNLDFLPDKLRIDTPIDWEAVNHKRADMSPLGIDWLHDHLTNI